jgi:hypothetical protein
MWTKKMQSNLEQHNFQIQLKKNINRPTEYTYLLTPWSRVLLEKLTGLKLVKKFLHCMEPEGSLPHSQVPATCLYPEPAQSSPYPHIPLVPLSLLKPYQIIRPCPRLCLWIFRNKDSFSQWVVSPSSKPQAGGPPLVGCPRLLIQHIRSYPPYWRPFLHPQPEGAPCHGDRDPLTCLRRWFCRKKPDC